MYTLKHFFTVSIHSLQYIYCLLLSYILSGQLNVQCQVVFSVGVFLSHFYSFSCDGIYWFKCSLLMTAVLHYVRVTGRKKFLSLNTMFCEQAPVITFKYHYSMLYSLHLCTLPVRTPGIILEYHVQPKYFLAEFSKYCMLRKSKFFQVFYEINKMFICY